MSNDVRSMMDGRGRQCRPTGRPRAARRGFSFAEVMFAVVILGIGFIMVAAIFPVAIQQTQTTNEESMGAAAAREGTNALLQAPASIPFIPFNFTPKPAPKQFDPPDGYQRDPSDLPAPPAAP